jgi:hypothetical protein
MMKQVVFCSAILLLISDLSWASSSEEADETTELLGPRYRYMYENRATREFREEVTRIKQGFANYETSANNTQSAIRSLFKEAFDVLRGRVLDMKLGYEQNLYLSPETCKDYEFLLQYYTY